MIDDGSKAIIDEFTTSMEADHTRRLNDEISAAKHADAKRRARNRRKRTRKKGK